MKIATDTLLTSNIETLERLTKLVTIARLERSAWEDCYTRLNDTIEAAHLGRTPRVALEVLQDAAQKSSQNLAKARLAEERANLTSVA